MMGGTITCSSELGKGTTFEVMLVNKKASEQEVKNLAENKIVEDKADLTGKRLLMCEDHPLNRQIAVKLLEKAGIIVESAEDGAIGVDLFKKSEPGYYQKSEPGYYQAILMDIRMPNMDGIEAAKAIRSLERPDAKTIPIIAMTANAFREDMEETALAGMNAHLSKPIEPQKLYDTLSTYLCRSH